MEGFVIKYTDINNLLWEYKSKLEGLISKLETCERSINQFIQSDQFIGETATAAKNYLYDVHITMISCLKVVTQNMLDDIAYHKACYNEIDGSTNFRLDEEAIREFRTKLVTNSADTESYAQSVQQAVSNISDISDVNTPGTNGIIELHEQLDQELLNFIETIQTQESTTVTIIENTVDLMVDSIKNCLGKIGTSKTAITTYTSNSFYTDIDVYTLAYLSEYFYQQHTVNQETYDAIWDVEQQLKDAAEEREVQGVIKAIGGIVLVVVGVACIAASLGAATPAVVAAGTMIGSGTTVFGITDTAEGAQDVYYGSISDLDSTAVNQLKEVVFQGNEEAYYFTEGVFSFAASAFIPIGKASTVGKLTFRSGSTIIAKEGLSTLAGEGVSKLTTDLSGNQTVGMMAGMLASGLTSHGLDKLDVKKNVSGMKNIAGFEYEHNPLDNPKTARDILKNPDAVYGYSPNPESLRIGKYADKLDWTDPEQVEAARKIREAYHNENEAMLQDLYNKGYTTKDIASQMVRERNMNRINSYIDTGNLEGIEIVKQSNLEIYGNEFGMSLEQALEKYGSYEEIINATVRSNLGMDACTGLYDIYYGGK